MWRRTLCGAPHKLYADDPRDLSRAPTLSDFLRRYGQFIRNCAQALKPNGQLAILMGDYTDREDGFVPLTFHTKRLAFEAGLVQPCTDIIRFSHGASSSRKVYRSSFIPGLQRPSTEPNSSSNLWTRKRHAGRFGLGFVAPGRLAAATSHNCSRRSTVYHATERRVPPRVERQLPWICRPIWCGEPWRRISASTCFTPSAV